MREIKDSSPFLLQTFQNFIQLFRENKHENYKEMRDNFLSMAMLRDNFSLICIMYKITVGTRQIIVGEIRIYFSDQFWEIFL